MLDDADKDASEFDPPDEDRVYRNYADALALSQCHAIVRRI